MQVKVRNYAEKNTNFTWEYFSAETLSVSSVFRKDVKKVMDAPHPPYGCFSYLRKDDKQMVELPLHVVRLTLRPKINEGAGFVFAEFGAVYIMNNQGKTIERV